MTLRTLGTNAAALNNAYVGYSPKGLDFSGATDVTAALAAALNAGERVHLKRGDYLLSSQVTINGQPGGDIILTADPGTRLIRAHTGRGIYQRPVEASPLVPVNNAAAGATTLQWTTSPGWTTDQWKDYQVELVGPGPTGLPVYDPAATYTEGDQVQYDSDGNGPIAPIAYQATVSGNVGNTPGPTSDYWTRLAVQRRRIVGNSADTLQLEWGLGALVGTGSSAAIFKPAGSTVMTGWKMLAPNGGQVGMVLNWPGVVDLDLDIEGTTSGNPLSVYHATGGHARLQAVGGSILGFLYNCEKLWVTANMKALAGVTTYHGLQAKDCRDTVLYDVIGEGLARVADAKGSGLNKTHNVAIRGGMGKTISQIAFDLYSLLNEGTVYVPENFSISDVKGIACSTVARAYDINTGVGQPRAKNMRIGDVQALDSTGTALVVNAPDTNVHDVRIIGSNVYPISLIGADRAVLDRVRVEQANRSATTTEVMRVTDTVDALTRVTVDVAAGDNTRRYINELGTSDRNKHYWTARDYSSVITSDGTLLGTSVLSKGEPAATMAHAALGMATDRIYTIQKTVAGSGSNTVTMGTAYAAAFTPMVDLPVSKLELMTGSAAMGGTATLVRIGLFTVASNGQATLVARTASDPTILNTANTVYSRSLDTTGGYPATYALKAGSRYAIGFIVVGATSATFKSTTITAGLAQDGLVSSGALGTGLTDLPTTATAIGNNTLVLWGAAVA